MHIFCGATLWLAREKEGKADQNAGDRANVKRGAPSIFGPKQSTDDVSNCRTDRDSEIEVSQHPATALNGKQISDVRRSNNNECRLADSYHGMSHRSEERRVGKECRAR